MLKISVITAVFNARRTIEQALDSVAGQDYPNLEHVVIDGASTDGTREVLERHRGNIATLVSEPDEGVYDALNKGIGVATGEVVGFLHADDIFEGPGVISRIARSFEDSHVDAAYGDLVYVSNNDATRIVRRWRSGGFSRSSLHWGWMPPHPTFYARRRVYHRLGTFDTRYRIAADYDCMLRFLGSGGVAPAYIPEVLVRMRVGGISNHSLRNLLRKSWEDYRALRANHEGGLAALAWKNARKLRQFAG
jgi:glycosyltransferase